MKEYTVFIPSYAPTRGEYEKPATIPEQLENHTFYGHTEHGKRILFAIGGTENDNFCSNWDIYADERGTLYSIARPGSGAGSTFFGDVAHVRNLIRAGHFSATLTEYGRRIMEGEKTARKEKATA